MSRYVHVLGLLALCAPIACSGAPNDDSSTAQDEAVKRTTTETFKLGDQSLTIAAGPMDRAMSIEVTHHSSAGTKSVVVHGVKLAHEDGGRLGDLLAGVDRALLDTAYQRVLTRSPEGHDAQAFNFVELALTAPPGQTVTNAGALKTQGLSDWIGYTACFYATWAAGDDVVDAGDTCKKAWIH